MSSKSSKTGDLACMGNISGKYTCTWKLKDFSKLDDVPGKFYSSPSIRTGKIKTSWYIKIYPGGINSSSEGLVCVDLDSEFIFGRINLTFTVELRNTKENLITSGKRDGNFIWSCGHSFLIKRKSLLPMLVDDVLVVHAEVAHTQAFVTDTDGKFLVCPEVNSELICNDMRRLRIEKIGADVVISVGKEDIPAHYAVLAARSGVFAAMFEHDTIEKSSRRVSITDFDVDSVKALLQFMYSGSIENLTIDLAEDMIRAADKYDINDLKIYCSNYLISRFDKENVANIVITADTHNAAKLRECAIQFMCDRKGEVDLEKHASVFTNRGRLLLDIIKCLMKDSDSFSRSDIYKILSQ